MNVVTKSQREHEKAYKDGAKFFRFTVPSGEVHEYVLGLSPVVDSQAVRQATGMPLAAFLPKGEATENLFGIDTIAVMLWLAMRQSTEPGKRAPRYSQVVEQIQGWDLEEGDLEVEFVDPDEPDDDPDGEPGEEGGEVPT